jgi:putative lipoic acid-binding regulatory protein
MNQDTSDVWQFPCQMTFKVMTIAREGIENDVISAIQTHLPGDYSPVINPSRKGNYYSISVYLTFMTKTQVDAVYKSVHAVEGVKMLL